MECGAPVQDTRPIRQEFGAPVKRRIPGALFAVEIEVLSSGRQTDGARGGVADRGGLSENFLHSRIGLERLAFYNPDHRHLPRYFRPCEAGGFGLYDFIQIFIEQIGTGRNGVDLFLTTVRVLNTLGWIVRLA
jgi:hypothetical protein